jgi:hypothetical protein
MAFKMSPIGRNKDPFASMAKLGYITPVKQSSDDLKKKAEKEMKNKDFVKLEPGDKGYDASKATSEGRRVLNEEQKQWLIDNPNYKGERKPISEVGEAEEFRYTENEPNREIESEGTESNIGIQGVEDQVYAGERKQEMEPYQKFVRYEGRGPGAKPIYETAYRPVTKEKLLRDYESTDRVNESDAESMSVEETNKLTTHETSGLSGLNTEYSGDLGTTGDLTLSDQNKNRELELKKIGESMVEQKKTPIYKKYMHKSMANQGCAKSEGGDGCVVKKDGKWVILNNRKGGIWRDNDGKGFANPEAAQKVLSGYHASKG